MSSAKGMILVLGASSQGITTVLVSLAIDAGGGPDMAAGGGVMTCCGAIMRSAVCSVAGGLMRKARRLDDVAAAQQPKPAGGTGQSDQHVDEPVVHQGLRLIRGRIITSIY